MRVPEPTKAARIKRAVTAHKRTVAPEKKPFSSPSRDLRARIKSGRGIKPRPLTYSRAKKRLNPTCLGVIVTHLVEREKL